MTAAAFMAALALRANQFAVADGYFLELLGWIAFGKRCRVLN